MLVIYSAVALFCVGAALLVHHGCKHACDDPATSHAQRESCALVCYFQPKDVAHLETWILVFLTNAATTACCHLPKAALVLCALGLVLLLALVVARGAVLCALVPQAAAEEGTIGGQLRSVLHSVSNH